jgi:hypothetical protein
MTNFQKIFKKVLKLNNLILLWLLLIIFFILAFFLPNFIIGSYVTEYPILIIGSPIYSKEEFTIISFIILVISEIIILLLSIIPGLLVELFKKYIYNKKYKFTFQILVIDSLAIAILFNIFLLLSSSFE